MRWLCAENREVNQSAFPEEDGAGLAFIGHDLGEREARGVIDADVDELPSGAADLVAAVMGDAVTGTHDATELFDIKVEQLAGELVSPPRLRARYSSKNSRLVSPARCRIESKSSIETTSSSCSCTNDCRKLSVV